MAEDMEIDDSLYRYGLYSYCGNLFTVVFAVASDICWETVQ